MFAGELVWTPREGTCKMCFDWEAFEFGVLIFLMCFLRQRVCIISSCAMCDPVIQYVCVSVPLDLCLCLVFIGGEGDKEIGKESWN